MTGPTLLTAILNYRTPELTLRSAAAALREMQGIAGEIVIVDNASGDDSVSLLSRAIADNGWAEGNRVRLIESGHNGGFGAGNNVAIRAGLSDGSRPDFVYVLNSDAFPEPGAIRRLMRFLLDTPGAGIAGSQVRGTDGRLHQTAFRFPGIASEFEAAVRTRLVSRLLADHAVALPIPRQQTRVDWCAGASLMLRRRMLDQIGLFDESYFLYFEETDLCRRAAAAGWKTWYVPQSEVVHIGSASTGMKTWRRTPRYWFDSRRTYFVKNHGQGYWAMATLAHVAGGLIWRLRRLVQSRPQRDPDHFLRDLVAHSLRAPFHRNTGPAPMAPMARPLTEDSK